MGSNFVTLQRRGTYTQAEVKREFDEAQDQDRYENGHSYSGGLGMARGLKFTGKDFASYADAESYLEATAEKFEEALAVRFIGEDGSHWLIGAHCSS